MSLSANVSEKAALIWAIADKLTGVYKPHEYGEVILPLTVIRRFDCILADTKDAVLAKYETVKNLPPPFFWRGGIKSEKSLQKSTKHVPWDVVEWRCNW